MGAPLDWLLTYDAARSGAFGDQSQAVMDRITGSERDKDKYQELLKKGIITNPATSSTRSNESGEFQLKDLGSIDWSQLPRIGPFDAPKGTGWTTISTDGSPGGIGLPSSQTLLGLYDDPNYGRLALVKPGPKDNFDRYIKPLLLTAMGGMIAGPAAAAIGASAGLSAGSLSQALLSAGIKTGLGSAIKGGTPNPFSFLTSLLKPNVLNSFSSLISGK